MATTPAKPSLEMSASLPGARVPTWPLDRGTASRPHTAFEVGDSHHPGRRDALQALLAFSALHQQIRRRRALSLPSDGFETIGRVTEFEASEQFVLDEVLQLVAERAIAITGADGLGIALAENNEIVLRASAGSIKPDVGARIQRDSAFSGACFRTAQIIHCHDTETDDRVNLYACRQLGTRSMVAVPLCGRRRVIGLLEAFSAEPFGFNDSDVTSLGLLAELIVGALRPEDEDRFAESAEAAEAELDATPVTTAAMFPVETISPEKALDPIEAAAEVAEDNDVIEKNNAAAQAAVVLPEPSTTSDAPKNAATEKDAALPPTKSEVAAETTTPLPTLAAPKSATLELLSPATVAPETVTSETASAEPSAEQRQEEALAIEAAPEPEPAPSTHHPGIWLVAVVVVALLVVGAWWKLKNAQLGEALLQPAHKTVPKPIAVAKQPVSPVPPATPSSVDVPTTTAAGPAADAAATEPNGESTSLQETSKLPRITGIRHWSSADSSTVVLDLEDQVQYEAHRLSSPDRIYFDLHDTSLAPDVAGKTIEVGDALLARVRVAQPVSGLTRMVLETKGNSNFSVSLEPNPYRLVVQVRKLGVDPKAQVNLFPGTESDRGKLFAIVVPPPTHEDLQLRARVPKMRIVVDAGHGGWDLGTVGRKGLLEKDLVLEIAQRLGKLLESRLGAEVILTRKDDNYIPLDERAGIANQSQADLFVSVHANYSDLPSARGVETYYTNFFSSPSAKEIEAREDGTVAKTTTMAALSPVDLHDRIEQSRRLAASVQRSLYGTLSVQNPGLRDRGVKEASYVVLTETAMPGILAEVSFVSSPTDEQKLRSDGYREQIAEALYKGIARYAASSRGVKMASAGK
jgi:N-acetylmuramoyl-L-alanine amidase/putative methionine-R-sulfoxide reductase with GAF domain